MENLINDLMDHAKMENNSFKFDFNYYSLSGLIHEAFQIMNFSANERGINLKAQIDEETNLQLIQAIYGDQRRIL